MKKVMIVEDDPVLRQKFSEYILQSREFELLAAAATCEEADEMLSREAPDVLLADLGLPDGSGVDVIRRAAAEHPGMEIMVITVFGDEEHVISSLEAGAGGYLMKDSLPEEFIDTIRQLCSGGSPISPVIARQLLKRLGVSGAPPAFFDGESDPSLLSQRESEVLRQIAKGFSFKEIAGQLEISRHTVTAHVKKIYGKLAVHSRGEAVYKAGQKGLI